MPLTPTEFEHTLLTEGIINYPFRGRSMLPLLSEKRHDLVTIRRKDGRLKKFDVALYRAGEAGGAAGTPKAYGKYILHRVIYVTADGYICRGDSCDRVEFVEEEQVIGVLTACRRRKRGPIPAKEMALDGPAARIYGSLRVRLHRAVE